MIATSCELNQQRLKEQKQQIEEQLMDGCIIRWHSRWPISMKIKKMSKIYLSKKYILNKTKRMKEGNLKDVSKMNTQRTTKKNMK